MQQRISILLQWLPGTATASVLPDCTSAVLRSAQNSVSATPTLPTAGSIFSTVVQHHSTRPVGVRAERVLFSPLTASDAISYLMGTFFLIHVVIHLAAWLFHTLSE